jgi:hypothetical protein
MRRVLVLLIAGGTPWKAVIGAAAGATPWKAETGAGTESESVGGTTGTELARMEGGALQQF